MEKIIVERPKPTWHTFIPFSRAKRDYKKDRDRYDEQFLSDSEKVRKKQELMINGVSALLIMILTTLWTVLPSIDSIGYWMNSQPSTSWMLMGFGYHIGSLSWPEHFILFVIPGLSGMVVHKLPNMIPYKKARFATNVTIKIIPVLLLIICTYLIFTEKQYWEYRKKEKQNLMNTLKKPTN